MNSNHATIVIVLIIIFFAVTLWVMLLNKDINLNIIPTTVEQIQKLLPPGFVVMDNYGDSAAACYEAQCNKSVYVVFLQRFGKKEDIRITLIYVGERK